MKNKVLALGFGLALAAALAFANSNGNCCQPNGKTASANASQTEQCTQQCDENASCCGIPCPIDGCPFCSK